MKKKILAATAAVVALVGVCTYIIVTSKGL